MLPSKIGTSIKILVVKTAPESDLSGEIYFYRCIQSFPRLRGLFPSYHASSAEELKIEYVHSSPLTNIFVLGNMGTKHMNSIFSALDILHTCPDIPVTVTPEQLKDFYISKLTRRIAGPMYNDLPNLTRVYAALVSRLKTYTPTCVPVIHGDPWFANLLWTYDEKLKCIDMRGLIGDTLTLNGDPLYDYAKVYQSLLGFDEVVFGLEPVDTAYRSHLVSIFLGHLRLRNVNPDDVFLLTLCNMVGSIPFHIRKTELWELIQTLLRT